MYLRIEHGDHGSVGDGANLGENHLTNVNADAWIDDDHTAARKNEGGVAAESLISLIGYRNGPPNHVNVIGDLCDRVIGLDGELIFACQVAFAACDQRKQQGHPNLPYFSQPRNLLDGFELPLSFR